MTDASEKVNFLAVLIYDDGHGRFSEEPRVYTVSHPEIAYQMAMAEGTEERYGRTFLGLSHLEETAEGIDPIARSQQGDARDYIVPKEDLEAFQDARWLGLPWDETELSEALRGPMLLFEIEGLESIAWHSYTHAYGPAYDVPKDIRRLAACGTEIREQALWQLGGTIYHQGSIFSATAVALPFLLRLALDHRLENRASVCELLAEIARSSAIHPELVRKNWAWRWEKMGLAARLDQEMVERDAAAVTEVRQAFVNEIESVRLLSTDADPKVAGFGTTMLQLAETPLSPVTQCFQCRGTGACFCKRRTSAGPKQCKRCGGTGKCHVCHGVGTR